MTGKPIWRVHVSITVLTSMSIGRVPSLWACRLRHEFWLVWLVTMVTWSVKWLQRSSWVAALYFRSLR